MIEGKTKQSKFQLRLELVRFALREGIREAARAFRCSRNTVRLWLRRYQAEGLSGLKEKSKAPRRIPHKTSPYLEEKVVEARTKIPCYGPRRLKRMFVLKPSIGAIGRILRQRGLTRKPKKRHEKKRDLREVKAKYRALTHHQADTKHLYDIARYWPQMKKLGLPRYQYTIRDTKSGALMLAYAQECSLKCAEMAAEGYLNQLNRYGIKSADVIFQTDGGSEFSGTTRKKADRGFTYRVEEVHGAKHDFIPPGCSNANADVESSHALIEQEFYDLECFTGLTDFLNKATLYQNYFNFVRPNSYKGDKTPWQIIQEERPDLSPEVLLIPPVMLDAQFRDPGSYKDPQVGQYLPVYPDVRIGRTLLLEII
jgi:transposase